MVKQRHVVKRFRKDGMVKQRHMSNDYSRKDRVAKQRHMSNDYSRKDGVARVCMLVEEEDEEEEAESVVK